jgi:hypothetical protein
MYFHFYVMYTLSFLLSFILILNVFIRVFQLKFVIFLVKLWNRAKKSLKKHLKWELYPASRCDSLAKIWLSPSLATVTYRQESRCSRCSAVDRTIGINQIMLLIICLLLRICNADLESLQMETNVRLLSQFIQSHGANTSAWYTVLLSPSLNLNSW